uniref:Uncharacterized protein n=1 Tax=Arundo donax TaxID=35708 RepID=A0A0A9H3Q3_ARUDO
MSMWRSPSWQRQEPNWRPNRRRELLGSRPSCIYTALVRFSAV